MSLPVENKALNDEVNGKMHKTSGYFRTLVTLHNIRDRAKETIDSLQEKGVGERLNEGLKNTRQAVSSKTRNFFSHPENVQCDKIPQKYSYIFRPKSSWELVLLSGTVCGIEFCYSAETAFVTPILLSLGLNIKFVTMIWCLSPLIGFFLTPLLGSLSDSCDSKFGRRRPFILLLSIGILLGLILVPNGNHIGTALGDTPNLLKITSSDFSNDTILPNATLVGNETHFQKKKFDLKLKNNLFIQNSTNNNILNHTIHNITARSALITDFVHTPLESNDDIQSSFKHVIKKRFVGKGNVQSTKGFPLNKTTGIHMQPWSIVFTVMGTVLLDFCSDACQSPSRTYLLDVSLPEDHATGLSTFTLMAGFGGSVGYMMGAIHWESTSFGDLIGGQVNAVFMIVTIVFIFCLIATLCSFPEMPLSILKDPEMLKEYQQKLHIGEFQETGNEMGIISTMAANYGTTKENGDCEAAEKDASSGSFDGIPQSNSKDDSDNTAMDKVKCAPSSPTESIVPTLIDHQPTVKEYLVSIVYMPKSLRILCLTNLFCWMSLVCYSLYFTDFVGEVVYGGNPQAAEGTEEFQRFRDGVTFGCWGMALYSISCSCYSYFIESLVKRLGAKTVYIGGQLVYSVGMVLMAAFRHPVAVILLSPTAGIMYSTLFTMPYLLIAHYHCMQKFRDDKSGGACGVRGIGTDVASVSSMVFLSQFILSLSVGSIVEAVGSNVATVCAASFLSACGAVCATQVMYLEL